MATKPCSKCKRTLPLKSFFKKNGKLGILEDRCKECSSRSLARWRKNNPEKLAEQQRRSNEARRGNPSSKRSRKRNYDNNRATMLCCAARARAAKQKVPYALTTQEIRQRIAAGVCELTGLPFVLDKPRSPFAPSLDRNIPALGYTSENTRVICFALNMALCNWGEQPLLTIVNAWQKKLGVFA